jgi:predicted phosphodiesterase
MNNYRKIAVLADIHGNSFALESVLEDIQKKEIKEIFNLGDVFYGPIDPQKTFELLSKHSIVTISGNMDRDIKEAQLKKNSNPLAIIDNQTLAYVMNSLSDEAMKWIINLPRTLIVDDLIYLCHGNKDIDDIPLIENIEPDGVYLKSDKELSKELAGIKQSIILCGHTHVPNFITLENGKKIINPGSVGLQSYKDDLPFFHKMQSYSPHSKYCVLEIENEILLSVNQILLTYDWVSASKMAAENGRKDWEQLILTGRCEN